MNVGVESDGALNSCPAATAGGKGDNREQSAALRSPDNDKQEFFYENLFGIGISNTLAAKEPNPTVGTDNSLENTVVHAQADTDPANEHESHCHSCFNLKECIKRNLNKDKEPLITSCRIIQCRLKCSQQFHACKLGEHEEFTCPKARIPCLNVDYGCPFVMERQFIGSHLSKCPASVVVCTVEWNRKPIASWQSEHYESYAAADRQQLDIAATKRDEQTVKKYYKLLPTSLRSLLRTGDKKQTIMPLGIAGTRIPNSILYQATVEKQAMAKKPPPSQPKGKSVSSDKLAGAGSGENSSNEESDNAEEEDDSSSLISLSEPSYGIRGKSPSAGLQRSVCLQLAKAPSIDKDSTAAGTGTTDAAATGASAPSSKKKSHVRLSPTIDVVVKDACKYLNLFTFMCSHEFRRDEYSSHFKNLHTEIHTQLNGWLFVRCPMAIYGCDFGVNRMSPTAALTPRGPSKAVAKDLADCKEGSNHCQFEIIRNDELDSFCYRQNELEIESGDPCGGDSGGPKSPLNICELPEELLMLITKYLDPLSLNALSMTNTFFLSICELIVSERGIVVLDWEKKGFRAQDKDIFGEVDGSVGNIGAGGHIESDPTKLSTTGDVAVSGLKKFLTCSESNGDPVAAAVEGETAEAQGQSRRSSSTSTSQKFVTGWEVVGKRWMFTKHFSPIQHWKFIQPGVVSNHLLNCPFMEAQRNRPTKPFCYPVTQNDL